MFGYSRTSHEVFIVPQEVSVAVSANLETNTQIHRLNELTDKQWSNIRKLQEWPVVLYLSWRYGSRDTFILISYAGQELAHIEWLVPAKKIKSRYSFIPEGAYAIISCLTSPCYRGRGIYPSQIQKAVHSDIPAKSFWIWTSQSNTASLKGIRKAGAIKVGHCIQRKWFWGCFSKVKYFPEESDKQP